ncbi:putative snf2 family helicase atpase protein [Botrytis fragariae]|uniref:Putative snf2 family helicase atpase protein n=1 Tax=Botrytis fragariae TaxID=1964551 RepID=A0A8H6ATT0_9HELO|nr:putative snf2 family helicase atpase protein [Botrytis fragariae]KAF5873364.1 putative snf2 family helicase atpase protein [Botrytis fragariae]
MEDDDPWSWSTDRIVQEFCTDQRSWELRAASTRTPDPVFLEKAFRENEITGDILLIEIDDKSLREDLQITKLGWRSFIRYGIEQLRERSAKYKVWLDKERASALVAERYSNSLPSVSSRPDFNFTINSTVPIHMPSGISGVPNIPSLQPLRLFTENEIEGPNSNSSQGFENVSISEGNNNKQQKLDDNTHGANRDGPLEPNHSNTLFLTPPLPPPHSEDECARKQILLETSLHASNEVQPTKTRKRIAPTLITTAIDQTRDRRIPTEADTVRIFLHSQLDQGYLGNSRMSVDDVFYGKVAAGEQILSGEMALEFQERSSISFGRRLYVHGLMKHFLRVSPELFKRNNKTLMAIKPYRLQLAPNPSFTLYRSGLNTTEITRQALASWPEIDPEAYPIRSSNAGKSTFDFDSNAEVDLLANAYEKPGALSKYNMLKNDDEELPLYGESGSENGFDTETWEAIDEEAKERAAYIEKEKQKNKFLTSQEVEAAVDAGIADLVSQWQEIKLPKRRQKAFRLWTKSRKTGSKHADILKAQQDLRHLVDRRIPKLRENIILGQWSNAHQVFYQTRVMEATIFDREDLIYTIALLQKKSPPPRLAADIPVKPKKTNISGNESDSGESIHSESSAVESVHDVGDFIVEELDLADDEEDVTMSDDSLPEASMTPSRRTAQPKSKASVQSDYVSEEDHHMTSVFDEEELESPEPIEHSPSDQIKSEPKVPLSTCTPRKNRVEIDLVTPESNRVSKLNLNHKSSSLVNPIVLSSESDRERFSERPVLDLNNLPSLTTPAAVSRFEYATWEDSKDRDRLIITVVDKLPNQMQKSLLELIATMDDETKLRARVEESIEPGHKTKGLDEQSGKALLTLIRLFWIFIDCKFHLADDGWMLFAANSITSDNFNSLGHFYRLCKSLQDYFNPKIRLKFPMSKFSSAVAMTSGDDEDEDGEPQGPVKRKRESVSSTSDSEFSEREDDSPSKKKRKFFEDANARNLREQDRARVTAQEERKKQLRARLRESDGVGDVALDRHIVNEGKYNYQGYIYVDEDIGKRIKPHQLEGVRFIWNQITADGEATQGCLLAHTMGLGKTMQTITILVTLAQAASSIDESISSQVPESLRVSKTIILCPPGLIANWVDEILTWSPDDILGDLRPVDSASDLGSRFCTIDDWFEEGGILLIGYDMFRRFIAPPKSKPDKPMTPSLIKKFERAKTKLLEGPNIVVADEAHKMKNYTSALNMAATQFRTKTRIALTGSPLANNVEEYHTMVEWVAPNYLGPKIEFRKKYKEPIEQGLFADSTRSEKFRSQKMLEILKADLSLKVHRADTSVLRDDLPPKKEFTINVSLTELQKQAYITYVRSMSSQKPSRTKSGELKQTTVWSYINILTLLCNHPYCFKAKLDARSNELQGNSQANPQTTTTSRTRKGKLMEPQDVTDLENDPEAWKLGVSEDLISAEAKVFRSVIGTITNPELSNKVRILCQILDASRAVGDKVLVFSQTLVTLDFLEIMCSDQGRKYARLDGKTAMNKRQALVKDFNSNDLELYLISTTAGGLGLNLYGANRVVIFDFKYNPINEEQAIGRAYRIGQKKHVFVYRLMAAGTFEGSIQNKAVFKTQLASRVVDKKNPLSWAQKGLGEILFEPREIPQEDLSEFEGIDSVVLDTILSLEENKGAILKIIQSDDFEKDDDYKMTPEEKKEVQQEVAEEQLKRSDPRAYELLMRKKQRVAISAANQQVQQRQPQMSSTVKSEMIIGNKLKENPENRNGNSDVEEISAGLFARRGFFRQLKKIVRSTDPLKNEDIIRQRHEHVRMEIQTFYDGRHEWTDNFQRMVYQRACAFIRERPVIAQQLFSSELGADEFLGQVASWWDKRSEPRSANERQVQISVSSDKPQELQTSVSLTQNGNGQVAVNDDKIESVASRQSGSLDLARGARMVEERADADASYSPVEPAISHAAASSVQQQPLASSTPFKEPNTLISEGGMKPAKSNDTPDCPSVPEIVPEEQHSLSQNSTGDIPNHRPISSFAEVILHPVVPSALITNPVGEDRISQFAENQYIGAVPLNNSVVATVNTNVKVDKTDKPDDSLSTTSSSSDETGMFRAMNQQPQSLRTPVVTSKKKKKHRGTMNSEDSEVMRQIQQRRLARREINHTTSPFQSKKSSTRSS